MTVQEFVNIDKDLQTVQDISDVNIIILIYLFIKHVLFILMYLHMSDFHEFGIKLIWINFSKDLQCSLVKPPPSVQSVVWRIFYLYFKVQKMSLS
jgi:hypothetical protein